MPESKIFCAFFLTSRGEIGEGTSEIQRLVIAREVIGKEWV
jgi:alkylation response protein AidB-like acyl-CoA dehydrogenase